MKSAVSTARSTPVRRRLVMAKRSCSCIAGARRDRRQALARQTSKRISVAMAGRKSPPEPPGAREPPREEPKYRGAPATARAIGRPKGPEPTRYEHSDQYGRCGHF